MTTVKTDNKFAKKLDKCRTEEAVKSAFVKEFKLEFNSDNRVDLLVPPVLFEFKLDLNLAAKWPVVLAQALYYVRRIRDESATEMPSYIALVDKNEGTVTSVDTWKTFLDGDYDWERAPSSPCPKLVQDITDSKNAIRILDFNYEIENFCEELKAALQDESIVKRPVTKGNFEHIFKAWERALGLEGQHLSPLFVADVCLETWFDPNTGELQAKNGRGKTQVPVKAYENFWAAYKRPPTLEARVAIKSRRDRLRAIEKRRFEGEFYTPPMFAEKAIEYLTKALGGNWQDEYVVWDPATGTGNLLWPLRVPGENVFASTLHKEDAASIDWYEGATVFQFDFLNDPVEKLPVELREALKREKVVVIFNPPFAEAGGPLSSAQKSGVSNQTNVHSMMPDMDKAKRELFVQFFWRVHQLCPQAVIGMFSTLKYINAPAFAKFREQVLDRYKFRDGFIFPAKAFQGTKGSWPVAFGIWDSNHGRSIHILRSVGSAEPIDVLYGKRY